MCSRTTRLSGFAQAERRLLDLHFKRDVNRLISYTPDGELFFLVANTVCSIFGGIYAQLVTWNGGHQVVLGQCIPWCVAGGIIASGRRSMRVCIFSIHYANGRPLWVAHGELFGHFALRMLRCVVPGPSKRYTLYALMRTYGHKT